MIYGLYLSATGIMTNTYRQDVIANNLANVETAGFKRDVADFKQRLTAAQENRQPGSWSDPMLEGLGGGLLAMPNHIDFAQGGIEETGSPLDVAIQGDGFFAVQDQRQTRLTRDGRFMVSNQGQLVLTSGQPVLDSNSRPINVSPDAPVSIDVDGEVSQNGQPVGRLGLFDVADRNALSKLGGGLLAVQDGVALQPTNAHFRTSFIEQSNVDPTTEMAELMDSQRHLEANANMIRTQDSTLQLLVNNVGKIS
ncbi:MAG TPA: flagellar basal-body rod protein FlgF [Tepidisphaeraceae bacterium]|nr:flagellar basal-body rod protein FlgF [Tepidisphaeraceae bacterium]